MSTGPYRSSTCRIDRRSANVAGAGDTMTRIDRLYMSRAALMADDAIAAKGGEGSAHPAESGFYRSATDSLRIAAALARARR